jgi:thermostable 8-oxoguanine DNA glycosylase
LKKAVADIGSTRVVGEVIKVNALTTLIKVDPESLIKVLRSWFLENGVSMREYREMLREYGITRGGIIKRHNLKHRVTYAW